MKKYIIKYIIGEKKFWELKNRFNEFSKFQSLFFSKNVSLEKSELKDYIIENQNYSGDFLDLFLEDSTYKISKWHHYLPLYERYLHNYKNQSVKILEIGVEDGGGMNILKKYFGESAQLYGIDIKPLPIELNPNIGKVFIGSQNDTEFLNSVIDNIGKLDIIIDDGSHIISDIKVTLNILLKHLNDGGIYIIEDLHTNYFKFANKDKFKNYDFFQFIKEVIDDIHSEFHNRPLKHPNVSKFVTEVIIANSFVVIKKGTKTNLSWSQF